MDRIQRAAVAFAVAGLGFAAPRVASACGGTFCDAGGLPVPVDQSGETVLFVRDGEHVEAHIQISYTGDPDEFAWIVPVPAVPELSVGSQALFDRLRSATTPTFATDVEFAPCDPDDDGDDDDGGSDGGDMSCGGGLSFGPFFDPSDYDPPEMEPERPSGELVGAYEVELLEAGTVDEVEAWIVAHDFQPDADAPAVLQEYIDEGFVFAAFTLRDGADLDEIHPLVVRYEGTEPCLPLRLTKIAAVEDMPVRVFALADTRVVPTNYMHVELDPVRLDWANGVDYDSAVIAAVDETDNGHGFVTEFAGPSIGVSRIGLVDDRWDVAALVGKGAIAALVELQAQGFTLCDEATCAASHPLLEALLERWIVVPEGYDRADVLRHPSHYDELELEGWDSIAFAAEFEERVTKPGAHALELLERKRWLTALFTRISPAEMTVDPMFHENPDLGVVSDVHTARMQVWCDDVARVTLDDGREIAIEGGAWPDFDDAEVPWAESIARVPTSGPPIVERDATDAIDEALVAANTETIHRTRVKPTLVSPEWGGWIEHEDDGCGACTTRGKRRNLSGPLWMLVLLTIALRMRSP